MLDIYICVVNAINNDFIKGKPEKVSPLSPQNSSTDQTSKLICWYINKIDNSFYYTISNKIKCPISM